MRFTSSAGRVLGVALAASLLAACSGLNSAGTPATSTGQSNSGQSALRSNGGASSDYRQLASAALRYRAPSGNVVRSSGGYNPAKKVTPVVYFSDAFNEAVYEYDQTGGASILTIGGLNEPQGIATDSKGNLYVANTGTNQVFMYPPGSTTSSLTIATPGYYPVGVAVLGNYVYVTNIFSTTGGPGSLESFLKNGNAYRSYSCPELNKYYFVAANKQGDVFVSGADISGGAHIVEFPQTSLNCTDLGISLEFPGGLAIDNAGNLLVDDQDGATTTYAPPSYNSVVATTDVGGAESTDPVTIALQKGNSFIWSANAEGENANQWAYPVGGTALITLVAPGSPSFSEPVGIATYPRGNK